MCTMVLKLRNLYKWEHALQPWEEAEAGELLDWIDDKERYWQSLLSREYQNIEVNGQSCDPDDLATINTLLAPQKLVYGAGYGRSMKAVFFLARQNDSREVAGCPVLILGEPLAREMASPLAMVQDGVIFINREELRYFLWDQIQELRSSCRSAFMHLLRTYDLLNGSGLDQEKLKKRLELLVDDQMNLLIYHEVGEIKQTTLDHLSFQKVIAAFPSSVIELLCRSLKDVLADTHPEGLLAYTIREKQEASLALYVGLLDGMRKHLFPEIFGAWEDFVQNGNWHGIELARDACRQKNLVYARKIRDLMQSMDDLPKELIEQRIHQEVLTPLGLAS